MSELNGELVYIAFGGENGSAVRGPYTSEQAAVESIIDDYPHEFHVEPRRIRDTEDGDCIARDVTPTY